MRAFNVSILIAIALLFAISCSTESTPTYTLTTTVSPSGGGAITPSTGEYDEGETINLTATPSNGWDFVRWEGDWNGEANPVNIGMTKNYNIVGIFQRKNFPLAITINGSGEVEQRIVSTAKSTEYTFETVVELTAVPSNGWRFVDWGGGVTSTDEVVTVTVDGEVNVTVTFERIDYPLTITIEGEGVVEQEVVQAKTTDYPFETVVQLTPVPSNGWRFVDWGGDLSGDEIPQQITVDSDKSVTATFTELQLATITIITISNITPTSAQSGGNVTDDGGASVTARGVCWSTSQNPTTDNSCTTDGSGTGSFTSNLTGLNPDTRYYVRAYATNSQGTAYGTQRWFHTVRLRDTQTAVVEVTSATGRIWMDRNLGASRAATSSTDTQAYGDLYQWGRAADGHQRRNSGTTSTLSGSNQPNHGSFILAPNSPRDWRSPQNNNLWQGVNGTNNPCPVGYRLPTEAEWEAERLSWISNNAAGAFNSPLKLPVAGRRYYSSGSLHFVGSFGYYWSGAVGGTNSRGLTFSSSNAYMYSSYRAFGGSVRCLKN